MRIWPGDALPFGATWDGEGVNFAVYSLIATKLELCLFDRAGKVETARIGLPEKTNGVWHAYLPDVRPGQLYGYRAHGPFTPEQGLRFNPNKLLIDPYAKAIAGSIVPADSTFAYELGHSALDMSFSERDSAPDVPKCVVLDTAFTWGDDRPPQTPWSRTVIYECHVRGMTALHPHVPEQLRGTYLGLASDAVLDHLQELGVTAVQLMPVFHAMSERKLLDQGLSNYWGYNTIGFFAADPRFASGARGEQVSEFKTMVKAFHRVGIEVLLDVVYNHTAEGHELGPTVCFRGLDNRAYYRLVPGDRRRYVDYTGCGNSWNAMHPRAMQLVLDSLRYWVQEMHVDGFRFDLAPTLAREAVEYDGFGRFFSTVQQDPVLSKVKLIAEPWDLGPGGYRLGAFPPGWAEWNGRYRDSMRRFWRGDGGEVPELASRLSGSSDIFQGSDRGPQASINFVTCHDGFSLHDLVSYDRKHNEANGEGNADGTNENFSRNWGAEGHSDFLPVVRLRERMKRNFIATLAFSQGVPMLSHGDEIDRTQNGNNNAYCQDNEQAYVSWELDEKRREFLEFVRLVLRIRQSNPVFRRRAFLAGNLVAQEGMKDVQWLRPDGKEMTVDDWNQRNNRVLSMLIHGDASDEVDERGRPNRGKTLFLLFNASNRARHFALPGLPGTGSFREIINTAMPSSRIVKSGGLNVAPHSLVLLSYEGS
ncbi:MAG TPA: glycogen debranching protein GlgX [Polyangiaceae bacterium]